MLEETRSAVEAILMVADQPVPTQLLAQITESSQDEIELLVRDLAASYQQSGHGFVLIEIAGGWRYQSHPDLAGYVERFVLEGQTSRLSAAALETLAIIAYKQPISRAQVSAIRGVSVDGVVRTLEQRGYIGEIGRDVGPGQPVLFGTTALFLEKLGLASVEDLPPIADFVPGPDVVEALEHGLRVDAAAAVEEREDAASGSAAGSDEGAPDGADAPERDDVADAAEAWASIDVDDDSAFEPSSGSVIDESANDSD